MAIPRPCGYDYKFIDTPPDRYICNICHLPSRDPYLTTCCGYVFCKSSYLDDSKRIIALPNVCPVCSDKEFVAYINKQLDREVKCLHVMCINKERGCEWQGELNDINNHLGNSDGCQFENVKCTNECGKMLERQYLTTHVKTKCPRRKVECQYCHVTAEHQFIDGEHKEQCLKLPLPCPNNCTSSYPQSVCVRKRRAHPYPREVIKYIPREDMETHKEECPLQEVECSFKCGKMLQRQYLTRHMETDCPHRKVDCQYCHIIGGYQFIEGEHKEQCPKLPLPCPNKCEIGSVLHEDMEAHRKECPLEMVQCEYHNVGCEERMMRKRKKGHEDKKAKEHLLMTKLKLRITEDKLSSTENKLTSTETRLTRLELMMHRLIHTSGSSNMLIGSAHWSSHLTAMAARVGTVSQICPTIVKISKFANYKTSRCVFCSEFFYSHSKGYKMCLRVYHTGDRPTINVYLSVFLCLMKGPHDDELTWPLRGKFEVILLNQISDCKHHSVTVTYDGRTPDKYAGRVTGGDRATGWGHTEFISNENLCKVIPTCQYLKDDCVFLQVSKL
ncbi:TNF receptor-associated factor 4-like [Dysidea avara]|uniref:TNF receptor-associated factor 4-like n=1 Tax=Dysidea avara TaxID=196820 RepID=UPI003320DD47